MAARAEVIPLVSPAQAGSPDNHWTIRAAHNRTPGVRTFYLTTRAGHEHTVQFIRRAGLRRWHCSCPDYFYRRLPRRRLCKHARLVVQLVQMAHGMKRLQRAIAQMKGGRS